MKRLPKEAALADAQARGQGGGCLGCELVRDAEPLATSEHAVVVLDRYAARPGHVLVLLRRHEENLAALPWPEYADLQHLAWKTCRALDQVLAPRRIYVAALGSAERLATSFPHLHLHVIPLSDGGESDRPAGVLTWAFGMYVFEDADEEASLRQRLQAAFALVG